MKSGKLVDLLYTLEGVALSLEGEEDLARNAVGELGLGPTALLSGRDDVLDAGSCPLALVEGTGGVDILGTLLHGEDAEGGGGELDSLLDLGHGGRVRRGLDRGEDGGHLLLRGRLLAVVHEQVREELERRVDLGRQNARAVATNVVLRRGLGLRERRGGRSLRAGDLGEVRETVLAHGGRGEESPGHSGGGPESRGAGSEHGWDRLW